MPTCEMCGHSYGSCGRLCIHDPLKRNALLFHGDGRLKTLKERGLGWNDSPVKIAVAPLRKNPPTLSLLKGAIEGVGKTVTDVTKNKPVVTAINVTEPIELAKRGRGRPRTGNAMSAAERKRKERAKGKPDKLGLPPRRTT